MFLISVFASDWDSVCFIFCSLWFVLTFLLHNYMLRLIVMFIYHIGRFITLLCLFIICFNQFSSNVFLSFYIMLLNILEISDDHVDSLYCINWYFVHSNNPVRSACPFFFKSFNNKKHFSFRSESNSEIDHISFYYFKTKICFFKIIKYRVLSLKIYWNLPCKQFI